MRIKNGCMDAPYYLAEYYLREVYYKMSYSKINEKIIYFYSIAIHRGNIDAMFKLGSYYNIKYDLYKRENSGFYYNVEYNLQYKRCSNEDNPFWIPMIKYYMMAINMGHVKAMIILADIYYKNKNYVNMIKYYKMAISYNNVYAMEKLGCYYNYMYDYSNMIKYYEMAALKGNIVSMENLGYYYETKNDYTNMIKYYDMVIKNKSMSKLENILNYYIKINNCDEIVKYCWIGINNDNLNAAIKLIEYYNKIEQNILKIFDIYAVCYYNNQYIFSDLNYIKFKLNLDNNKIKQLFSERESKIYFLINNFIKCIDLCKLICNMLHSHKNII
jgi:TPR repeat protein